MLGKFEQSRRDRSRPKGKSRVNPRDALKKRAAEFRISVQTMNNNRSREEDTEMPDVSSSQETPYKRRRVQTSSLVEVQQSSTFEEELNNMSLDGKIQFMPTIK